MKRGTGAVGAVVVGGHATGLGVVRCLSELDIPIEVVVTRSHDFAHYSRYVSGHEYALDLARRPESLVALLDRQAERWRGWVVLPTNDHAIAALAQHHEHLSRTYRLITMPWDVAGELLDKDRFYAAAERVGVAVPRIYGMADASLLERADLRFPLLVKPVQSHRFFERFRCKLFMVDDHAQLREAVAKVNGAGLRAQVMAYIPGGDDCTHNYFAYVDRRGEPVGGMGGRKLRKSPPRFGVGRMAEVGPQLDPPELREATLAVLREVGYRGIASADFKRDARDGRFYLIEINARPFLIHRLPWRAGFNMPALAYRDAAGLPLPEPQIHHWPGVWVHLHEELRNALLHRREEQLSLRAYVAPYGRPKTCAVWSARDPRPFLRQWALTAGDVGRAVGRRVVPKGAAGAEPRVAAGAKKEAGG